MIDYNITLHLIYGFLNIQCMQLKQLLFGGLFFAAFSVGAVPSHAQAGRLGVNAGLNLANISGKDAPSNRKLKAGFQAGVTYDIGLAEDFVLQPGLSYVQNGGAFSADEYWGVAGDTKLHLNYVQLPITFQYQPVVGNGNLLLGVGPYVGLGVGKIKVEGSAAGVDVSAKVHWDDIGDGEKVRKFDAGGKFLVGYQLPMGLSFNVNANFGMIKLDPDYESKVYNTAFGLTVGYKF